MELIWDSLPRLIDGTLVTIQITAISVLIGFVAAVPLALLRLSHNPFLRVPVYSYIFYFRGTPFIVQLFLIYYGSGQFRDVLEAWGLWIFFKEAYFCAILALTLNTAAYTAEIFRGAIQGVPYGEIEAARACGMSRGLLYRRIILPKALRLALPAYSNEVVLLLQTTSIVSIIALLDLTGVARVIIARSFEPYKLFFAAAVIYLVMTYGVLYIFKKVEFWLSGHLRERPDDSVKMAAVVLR
jgi:His/Glu/Gln/Arg/opine family amino acid ABC transporter permease subunit